MSMRRQFEPEARRLRKEGKTLEQIAEVIGVSERSVRRWLSDTDAPERQDPWPDTRTWPNSWTLDTMRDLDSFDEASWEGNLALIHVAHVEGNKLTPWFFRRLVELGRRRTVPAETKVWWLAVAALPPIGYYIGALDEAEELSSLIESTGPWKGKSERRAYMDAARPLAEVIRRRLFIVQGQHVHLLLGRGLTPSISSLYAALHSRTPEFDKPPRFSIYRLFPFDSVIMGLLASAQEDM